MGSTVQYSTRVIFTSSFRKWIRVYIEHPVAMAMCGGD